MYHSAIEATTGGRFSQEFNYGKRENSCQRSAISDQPGKDRELTTKGTKKDEKARKHFTWIYRMGRILAGAPHPNGVAHHSPAPEGWVNKEKYFFLFLIPGVKTPGYGVEPRWGSRRRKAN